jgi:CspA family cold shock protein
MMNEGPESGPQGETRTGVTATVKWFNPFKGFGFVQLEDGSPDAFLHISVLSPTGHQDLPDGATIVCDISEGQRGLQVASIVSIESLPEAPPVASHSPAGAAVEGRVKFYNPVRGFGFVIPDDGGDEVFISARTLQRVGISSLETDQRVRLTTRMGHKGPMAQSLEIV